MIPRYRGRSILREQSGCLLSCSRYSTAFFHPHILHTVNDRGRNLTTRDVMQSGALGAREGGPCGDYGNLDQRERAVSKKPVKKYF